MNQWSLLFVAPLLAYSSQWIAGYSFSAHYLLALASVAGSLVSSVPKIWHGARKVAGFLRRR